jgi:hypothetical protein
MGTRPPAPVLPTWMAIVLAAFPCNGQAQLISPGKLSAVHADLEGVRSCTQCHELRRAGVAAGLCLGCHQPLAQRLEARRGFHASLVESECATCHKEHLGRDFDLVRFDTLSFAHERVGYGLEGRHAEVGCRDCHRRDRVVAPDVQAFKSEHGALGRTFMGLPTRCAACHGEDSPHGTEFPDQPCADCHGVEGWEGAEGFDHGTTSYPLTGQHGAVACDGCHGNPRARPGEPLSLRFAGVQASRCSDCHADPHSGSMKGRCASCHATSDWRNVNRRRVESSFDHSSTEFDLQGSHTDAPCASCHDARASGALQGIRIRFQRGTARRTFPPPISDGCPACHEDQHQGVFREREGGGACDECHSQRAWLPSRYDLAWHNREAAYSLEGAHMVVPCASCHTLPDGETEFRIGIPTCQECHESNSPHGSQFAERACESCHVADSFEIDGFDHDGTRYPLDGAHRGVECASCHPVTPLPDGGAMVLYRPLDSECRDCHGGAA